MKPLDETRTFSKNQRWVKGPVEIEMEFRGYKLFSNQDPSFPLPERHSNICEEARRFMRERGRDPNIRTWWPAYDHSGIRLSHPLAQGIYVHLPELIIPARVVIRDWGTLEDIPYDGSAE